MDANSGGSGRRRFSRRDLVVLVAILGLLLGLAFPALQIAREKARRLHCANNLLQIGLALKNYHEVHRQFPPAYQADAQERPVSSWRFAILPFISSNPFYDLYARDEPWNSPGNLRLVQGEGYFYRCPDDGYDQPTTNYLAVTGAPTAWPVPASTSLVDFSDPSRSLLVVESANTGIHWLEPRDLEFERLPLTIHAASWLGDSSDGSEPKAAVSSRHRRGSNVLFADGSLEFLGSDTSAELLKELLVIDRAAAKVPLGARHRLRLVFLPDSTEGQSPRKEQPFKIEAYTTEEAGNLHE